MKDIKLYNMILPPFMLLTFVPIIWIFSMIGNFIIDSAVILALLSLLKKDRSVNYKKVIFRVWIFGYAADVIGAIYLSTVSSMPFINAYFSPANLGEEISNGINSALNFSHFDSIWGVLFILSGILIAAVFIFIFDYKFVFKKHLAHVLTKRQMIIASLAMSIFTAPYTFLLPKELFY
ncbi:MAG: hypothetical protein K6F76_03975 [Clostridiales bacterium]|nr:hypothetical protein [Clostridiales bacterium]